MIKGSNDSTPQIAHTSPVMDAEAYDGLIGTLPSEWIETPQKGLKYDSGKLRFDLIPPFVEEELAKIMTYGAEKYADNSWQNVNNGVPRYYAALRRHLNAYMQGEKNDPESGFSHLSHCLANISFLMHFERRE